MNERFRLPIAALISLMLNVAMLFGLVQLLRVRAPDPQGLLQVFLQKNLREQERPLQLPTGTSAAAIKKPQPKPVPIPPQPAAGGRFRTQPPAPVREDELMNTMHLAQLAQQRESQKAAVMAAMSGLAAQLGPVVNTRIVCTQQPDREIECTPEPEANLRPLLAQLLNLSVEARRLGAAANPVRMDFGPERSVSVILLP